MPLDPQVFHDLHAQDIRECPLPPVEERFIWMGLYLPSARFAQLLTERWQVVYTHQTRFACRLLWGPWDPVVSRRAEAQARKVWLMQNALIWDHYIGHVYPLSSVELEHLRWMAEYRHEIDRLLRG